MSYDAFVFDLDGTLIFTPFEFRYLILNKALKRFGLELDPELHKNLIDEFWFSSKRDEIVPERFKVNPEDFWTEYRIHDTIDLRRGYAEPYDDLNFVKEIKEMGKKTGIVTGAPVHIANFYVEELMCKDLFDSLIFARKSGGLKKKPNSQALLVCIEELGTDRGSVIYTGNSEEDILMGKAAGVFTAYVDREEWEISKEVEPPLRIHSLYELGAFI